MGCLASWTFVGMAILFVSSTPAIAGFVYTATFDPKGSFSFLPESGLVQGDYVFWGTSVEHIPDFRGGDSPTDGALRSLNYPSQGIWVRRVDGQPFDPVAVDLQTVNSLPDGSATHWVTFTPYWDGLAGTPHTVRVLQDWGTYSFPAAFQGMTTLNASYPVVMDNMVLSIVPEPSTSVLVVLGILIVSAARPSIRHPMRT